MFNYRSYDCREGKRSSPSWNTRRLNKDKLREHLDEFRLMDELGWAKSAGSLEDTIRAARRKVIAACDRLMPRSSHGRTGDSSAARGMAKSKISSEDRHKENPTSVLELKKLEERPRAWVILIKSSTLCGTCFHTWSRFKARTEVLVWSSATNSSLSKI